MKKILALVLAMVMCFSLLAACGSKDDGAQSTGGANAGATNSGSTNTGAQNTGVQNTGAAGIGGSNTGTPATVTPVNPEVKYRDTIKIAHTSGIQNGAFYSVTNTVANFMSTFTHQPLFVWNYETGAADPVLVKGYKDVNGDGKTWNFTLVEGVKFYQGDKEYGELKASDVKYTYEYCAPKGKGVEEGVILRTISAMNSVDKIETNGDYELTFYLNAPLFDFPGYLTWKILSEDAMKEFGTTDGQDVGSGPYYVNWEESMTAQYITMTRRDNYWKGIENHPTKNIVFMVQPDANTSVNAMLSGEVNMVLSVSSINSLQFKDNDDYVINSTPGANVYTVFFNSYDGTGFFDGEDGEKSTKVRQAIQYGIDKDALVKILFPMGGGVRADSLWHPSGDGYVNYGQTEFSIEKAQNLMKELGYGENNRLALKIAHYQGQEAFVQCIQDALKAIYIDLEIVTMDSSKFGSTLRTGMGWDMCVNYYGPALTVAGVMTANLHSTGSNAKTYGWNSAEMDKRIDAVMAETTAEGQYKAFAEFQEWANAYVPRLPLYIGTYNVVFEKGMEGYLAVPKIDASDLTTLRMPE